MDLRLYQAMTRIAGLLNTCTFVDGLCEAGRAGCCTGCPALDAVQGCMRNSLVCKLWVCDDRRDNLTLEQLHELETLWLMGKAEGFLMFRGEPTDATTPNSHRWGISVATPMGDTDSMHESWWAFRRSEDEPPTYDEGYNDGYNEAEMRECDNCIHHEEAEVA